MIIEEILSEMPQDISDIDWHDLNKTAKNKELYKVFSSPKYRYKKTIMQVFDRAFLYQDGTELFCLDTRREKVVYYVKFKVAKNRTLGQYLCQTLLWNDDSSSYTSGLPAQIFFDRLLPKYKTIITDSQQTWNGKRFWKLRIQDSFKKNLNVYYYDFKIDELIKVNNPDEFDIILDTKDIWGIDVAHQMKRMVISIDSLTKNNIR